jgi:pyruvate,orthophosphate dikinase
MGVSILNIGFNDETAKGLVDLTGNERFVHDSFRTRVQHDRYQTKRPD